MDNIWHRGSLKYRLNKGLTHKDIHCGMISTLEDDVPVVSTVQKYAIVFSSGRKNLEDDARCGRPESARKILSLFTWLVHMVMDGKILQMNI